MATAQQSAALVALDDDFPYTGMSQAQALALYQRHAAALEAIRAYTVAFDQGKANNLSVLVASNYKVPYGTRTAASSAKPNTNSPSLRALSQKATGANTPANTRQIPVTAQDLANVLNELGHSLLSICQQCAPPVKGPMPLGASIAQVPRRGLPLTFVDANSRRYVWNLS